MIYSYRCPMHGEIESTERGDASRCYCGRRAKRRFVLSINSDSARHRGRWDPVVGEYVESERQFRALLAKGQDEQAAKLGMDVKLVTVDARDTEGLAELHGHSVDDRKADMEATRRAEHDRHAK